MRQRTEREWKRERVIYGEGERYIVKIRKWLWDSDRERETERQNTKQAAYNVVFEKIFIFKNPIV